MKAATITVRSSKVDEQALNPAFDRTSGEFNFSTLAAPANRGVEIHVTSDRLSKIEMKNALRKYRAQVEAGEVPTGERQS